MNAASYSSMDNSQLQLRFDIAYYWVNWINTRPNRANDDQKKQRQQWNNQVELLSDLLYKRQGATTL